ncbi:hypothetical protein ABPG75_001001 [Micractinium tetrahymenae]
MNMRQRRRHQTGASCDPVSWRLRLPNCWQLVEALHGRAGYARSQCSEALARLLCRLERAHLHHHAAAVYGDAALVGALARALRGMHSGILAGPPAMGEGSRLAAHQAFAQLAASWCRIYLPDAPLEAPPPALLACAEAMLRAEAAELVAQHEAQGAPAAAAADSVLRRRHPRHAAVHQANSISLVSCLCEFLTYHDDKPAVTTACLLRVMQAFCSAVPAAVAFFARVAAGEPALLMLGPTHKLLTMWDAWERCSLAVSVVPLASDGEEAVAALSAERRRALAAVRVPAAEAMLRMLGTLPRFAHMLGARLQPMELAILPGTERGSGGERTPAAVAAAENEEEAVEEECSWLDRAWFNHVPHLLHSSWLLLSLVCGLRIDAALPNHALAHLLLLLAHLHATACVVNTHY